MNFRNRENKRILVLILASAATFILMFGVVYALKIQDDSNKGSPDLNPSSSSQIAPVGEAYINVLVCGIDRTDILTDVLMLGRFDVANKKINVLQIPRDTYIGTSYKTGKINSVYGHPKNHEQGIDELMQLIEDQLVLDIDYYAAISLDSLINMVDDLGGIEIDIPMRIEYLPGKTLEEGLQTINGEQAEWFVRYRKGYAMGDIGRINAQELFLKSAIKAVKDKGRMKSISILMNNFSNVKTDMPMSKAISIANEAFYLSDDDIRMTLLPGNGKMNGSYAVYEADKIKLAEILNEQFRTSGNEVSADDLNIPLVPYTPPPAQSDAPEESISSSDSSDNSGSPDSPDNPDSSDYPDYGEIPYDEFANDYMQENNPLDYPVD